jgi:hypothetical protein
MDVWCELSGNVTGVVVEPADVQTNSARVDRRAHTPVVTKPRSQ